MSTSPAATAEDFRFVINRYWSFVRRYPTSGFADNALWQAANLSADAFQRFSQDRDRYRAVQLFQWLRDQYPHSPLQAKVLTQIEQFETMTARRRQLPPPAGAESIDPRGPSRGDAGCRARDGRARSRSALLSGAPGRTGSPVFRSQRHEDRAVARRCDVPLRLGHRPAHPSRTSPEQHDPRRPRSGERGPIQRVHAVQPVSHRDRRRAFRRRSTHDDRSSTTGRRRRNRGHSGRRQGPELADFAPKAGAPIARDRHTHSTRRVLSPVARAVPVTPDPPVAPPAPVAPSRARRTRCSGCPRRYDRPSRDCGQTDRAVGEFERQVLRGAPAGSRRIAHRHRCRPWRARSRCVGVWHLRS